MTIESLYNYPQFISYCKKIAGNEMWEDLRSTVIERLLVLEVEKFNDIKNLPAFANRIAFNEKFCRTSVFNKELGNDLTYGLIAPTVESEIETIDKDYFCAINVIEKDLLKELGKENYPVEHYVFKVYLQEGTIRKVSEYLNISKSTIHRILTTYKKRIANEAIRSR